MYHNTDESKALLLSKEEALALLDMCVNSAAEMQSVHERALNKLGDLARSYMAEEITSEAVCEPTPAQEPIHEAHPCACDTPVRMTFWTRATIRSRLRSLPPVPEVEACS